MARVSVQKGMEAALCSIAPGEATGILGTFRRMELAEGVLKESGADCFALLIPPAILSGLSDDLYVAHCRELVRRVQRREDTRPATDAELLANLSRLSLQAPMPHNYAVVMGYLFDRCKLGKRANVEGAMNAYRRELLADMRRKFHVADRKADDK